MEKIRLARRISSRFNFDTYKLVRQLEKSNFTRGQSVALMRTINAFLVDSTLSQRKELISEQELENESYLAKAHLQELRNELSALRQQDSQNLKGSVDSLLREIETLDQNYTEGVVQLKSDITMDLNSHKAESKEHTTSVDLRIQEIHHKLITRLADLKTSVETSKVDMTASIGWWTVGAIAIGAAFEWVLDKVVGQDADGDAASSSSGKKGKKKE